MVDAMINALCTAKNAVYPGQAVACSSYLQDDLWRGLRTARPPNEKTTARGPSIRKENYAVRFGNHFFQSGVRNGYSQR
jgi:hypothetical protein